MREIKNDAYDIFKFLNQIPLTYSSIATGSGYLPLVKQYLNKSGKSGIVSYDFTEDHIDILFKDNDRIYRYKISDIGSHHLLKMIKFALDGAGLATYISQHPEIKDNYELI